TEFWERVTAVREAVSKELEKLRGDGRIGSSLDAEVDLYADVATRYLLESLGDELRFLLITSYARVHHESECPGDAVKADVPGLSFSIKVSPSNFEKCIRCWHHREDVGSHGAHPELCGRCVDNVSGEGESRRFV
ncbi:MAG: zinc finger domain-containing protein, partial [Gammaproteobacteria bacterium]